MKCTLVAFTIATLGLVVASSHPVRADVITEWDQKATAFVTPLMAGWGGPNMTQRAMTMVDLAMFEAVNAIEPRYHPLIPQAPASSNASKDAAAAVAAGTVLLTLVPANSKIASDIQVALSTYLEAIPPSDAKSLGIKIGQEAANSVIKKCASDGSDAPDAYRPKTKPGEALRLAPCRAGVNGHRDLPTGGHENSPGMATKVPADGHRLSPGTVMKVPGDGQVPPHL